MSGLRRSKVAQSSNSDVGAETPQDVVDSLLTQLMSNHDPEARSIDGAINKLHEAEFFLSKLEAEEDSRIAEYYFSGFLSAARSVPLSLVHAFEQVQGFLAGYDPILKDLDAQLVVRMMKVQQQRMKKGARGIVGASYDSDDDLPRLLLDDHIVNQYGLEDDDNDVIWLCQLYMSLLVKHVGDVFLGLQPFLDPHTYMTAEWLKANNLTPEDIERQKGLPAGWSRGPEGADDWEGRLQLLLANTPAWPNVEDLEHRLIA